MEENNLIHIYKLLEHIEFDSISQTINHISKFNFDQNYIHHIGFIVPESFNELKFKESFEKYCIHEKFKALLGYVMIKNLMIEFIKPINDKSILKSQMKSNHFKFDHICIFENKVTLSSIRITKPIATCLFEGTVSFELIKNKYKIEILHK